MRSRSNNISGDDGNSVHRVRITMRDDEFLRGDSDNEPDISDTICRGRYSTVSMRGIFSIKSNIEQIL